MRRIVCVVCTALLIASCGKKAEDQPATSAAAAPSQRKIDTAIANSGLPGARGVGRAMSAVDQAAERQRVQDSIAESIR